MRSICVKINDLFILIKITQISIKQLSQSIASMVSIYRLSTFSAILRGMNTRLLQINYVMEIIYKKINHVKLLIFPREKEFESCPKQERGKKVFRKICPDAGGIEKECTASDMPNSLPEIYNISRKSVSKQGKHDKLLDLCETEKSPRCFRMISSN